MGPQWKPLFYKNRCVYMYFILIEMNTSCSNFFSWTSSVRLYRMCTTRRTQWRWRPHTSGGRSFQTPHQHPPLPLTSSGNPAVKLIRSYAYNVCFVNHLRTVKLWASIIYILILTCGNWTVASTHGQNDFNVVTSHAMYRTDIEPFALNKQKSNLKYI